MVDRTSPLAKGAVVDLQNGKQKGVIDEALGTGRQGSVYRITVGDAPFALKWYHDNYIPLDPRLRERLTQAISKGSPSDKFIWPIDLATLDACASFGYMMPLIPEHTRCMRHLLDAPPRRINPALATRAIVCVNLAEGFLRLHAKGLCYCDVNLDNLYLDPASGDIRITDNDNVDVEGVPPSVYGTQKFMAPEIVRREAMPTLSTDLFSLAILFFYTLFNWHPLDGRREAQIQMMTDAERFKIYGQEPKFIFDPSDDSNGPVSGLHDGVVRRWNAVTDELRRLFVRSFTEGLAPSLGARVFETEWRTALVDLRDQIVHCPACGYAQSAFADRVGRNARSHCVSCRAELGEFLLLRVGRSRICLDEEAKVYLHHLDPAQPLDFSRAAARVVRNPSEPEVLGLTNLGEDAWSARLGEGEIFPIPPGKTIRLKEKLDIDFGGHSGFVVSSQNLSPGA